VPYDVLVITVFWNVVLCFIVAVYQCSTLKVEEICSYEMWINNYETAWCHIPEDSDRTFALIIPQVNLLFPSLHMRGAWVRHYASFSLSSTLGSSPKEWGRHRRQTANLSPYHTEGGELARGRLAGRVITGKIPVIWANPLQTSDFVCVILHAMYLKADLYTFFIKFWISVLDYWTECLW
jgi:hypothetical protein